MTQLCTANTQDRLDQIKQVLTNLIETNSSQNYSYSTNGDFFTGVIISVPEDKFNDIYAAVSSELELE